MLKLSFRMVAYVQYCKTFVVFKLEAIFCFRYRLVLPLTHSVLLLIVDSPEIIGFPDCEVMVGQKEVEEVDAGKQQAVLKHFRYVGLM